MNIADLKLDSKNANRGTQRGRELVKLSLQKYKAGRSILVDKHGNVIAGNKTLEEAKELGYEIDVIKSDGKRLIVHQRTDLDIKDPAAKELAIADNRTSELGLDWNYDILGDMPGDFLEEWGLDQEEFDPAEHWRGMPEFEQEDKGAFRTINVHFQYQEDVNQFSELIKQTISDKTKFVWFPEPPKSESYKEKFYQDES